MAATEKMVRGIPEGDQQIQESDHRNARVCPSRYSSLGDRFCSCDLPTTQQTTKVRRTIPDNTDDTDGQEHPASFSERV